MQFYFKMEISHTISKLFKLYTSLYKAVCQNTLMPGVASKFVQGNNNI